MCHFMSSLVTWDVVILVLIILKTHVFGYMTFNMKYHILSQILYKKICRPIVPPYYIEDCRISIEIEALRDT